MVWGDAFGQLIRQQWRDFEIRRFDSRLEEMSSFCLIPQAMVKGGVCDLLKWANVVDNIDGALIVVRII